MLVEIADRTRSEKPIVVRTKSQEGQLCVTICLGKGRERDRVSPCWTLRGATGRSLAKFGVTDDDAAPIVCVIAGHRTHVAVRRVISARTL